MTGSDDQFVKCLSLQSQNILWEFKMNSSVFGLTLCFEDNYLLALAGKNQLVLLDMKNGNKLLEFNKLSTYCDTLRLNPRTNEIFVGDDEGTVRRLKIIF